MKKPTVRLLVCGGRDFTDRDKLENILEGFEFENIIECVIEGEAPGADTMAREWAEGIGIDVKKFPADWKRYGRAAGPKRNQQMLVEGKPTYAFAFYDRPRQFSKGTADMVTRLKKAGITVEEVDHE